MTRKGWLLFAAISVFWGIPYLFIKVAVRTLDPSLVVFSRVGLAAVLLLPLAARRGALQPLRGRLPAIGGLALLQIAIPFCLISYGEQHISSSITSLLIASEPMIVALLAVRFDASERVRGARLAGLLVGTIGVAALFGLDTGSDRLAVLGAVLVLLATLCYAISALLLRRTIFASLPSLGVVTVECSVATLALTPLALVHLPARMPGLPVVGSLMVLGVVCTALAELTFFALVAEVGASRGTVFTYVNPAVAVLLGILLLGEPLDGTTVAGFLLIVAGSWLSTGGSLPPRWRMGGAQRGSRTVQSPDQTTGHLAQ